MSRFRAHNGELSQQDLRFVSIVLRQQNSILHFTYWKRMRYLPRNGTITINHIMCT